MAKESLSPEETLLNIIIREEGKQVSPSNPAPSNLSKWEVLLKKFFSKFQVLKKVFVNTLIIQEGDTKRFNILFVNRLLRGMNICLFIIVMFTLLKGHPTLSRLVKTISNLHTSFSDQIYVEEFKSLKVYKDLVSKRDIFTPIEIKVEKKFPSIVGRRKSTLDELLARLKLVGIAWGTSPEALIKDTKGGQVYFLREGQVIGTTGVIVKVIYRDKVVVSYNGEERDLK